MAEYDEMLIRVQAAWNDWRAAEVRLGDLCDVHWRHPSDAPHALVHGYISCSRIVTGDLPHWCDEASAPHRLRVCVLKRHTLPVAYAELLRRAGAQRASVAERDRIAVVRRHDRHVQAPS